MNFDGLSKDEADSIPYLKFEDSLNFIGQILVGEGDSEAFYLGEAGMAIPLTILYCSSTFVTVVHMLNMLIAIMGNTFEVGN